MTTQRYRSVAKGETPWALVTGCTDGIGWGLARELARRGFNMVLVSRTAAKLQQRASELESEFRVKTRVIPFDVCDDISSYTKLPIQSRDIAVLVNNVGISTNSGVN